MKIDGLQLVEGGVVTNLGVATGTTFPTGPSNPPNAGELFFQTGTVNKLFYYDGTSWLQVSDTTTSLDPDLVAIAALAGTSGLLRKTAPDTWTLDTNSYLTSNQTITLSGDVTGSGTTAITATLATVTQSTGSNFVKIDLDTKGRVIGNTAVVKADLTALGVADNSTVVHLAGAETITGNKTFSGTVVVPEPTGSAQAATKNYTDTITMAMAIVFG
jgi:hypothetical protein